MDLIIKKCMKCGAIVDVLNDCTCDNCGIKCCGENMKTFSPNTEDASIEKHLPIVEIKGERVIVKVPHVMEDDHFIEWISIVSEKSVNKQILKAGDVAEVEFPYIKGSKVYSYCNKHGLWSSEVN